MALLGLALLGALLAWPGGRALVPPGELKQLSAAGSKYIDAEVENAINGVKQMKTLMDKTSKDHRAALHDLEETKRRKEAAVRLARAKERQLAGRREACNGTALALWDECKPCLKRSCVRLYAKTCHSGAGLVGRQLEELLNRSSPFSVWVDGERVDALLERDRWQERRFEDLEERFRLLEDGVGDLLQDVAHVYAGASRVARDLHPDFPQLGFPHPGFPHPGFPHPGFHRLFQPLLELTQRMFEEAQREPWLPPQESRNTTDGRMVCREIRRNSAGCLKMRDECEKCRELLTMDCSQTDPEQRRLREQLEDALRLAERFTRRYDELLGAFQAEMLNTTGLLEHLNRQFGWVSRLANATQRDDGFLQVTTVLSKAPNPQDPSAAPDTQVTVQLFDSEPLVLTVPGAIAWDDPRFMELVAEQALQHYKQRALE
ncbi:clusterin isoform X2 [Dromaius novaehollandiae]|uniref:clusterin isoform X2 n=1 Tax=Dromaius novaehollandiae TaxID=8790 RepID=UPI0031203593